MSDAAVLEVETVCGCGYDDPFCACPELEWWISDMEAHCSAMEDEDG